MQLLLIAHRFDNNLKLNSQLNRIYCLLILFLGIVLLCSQCQSSTITSLKKLEIVKGHCGSCHLMPQAKSLSQDIWQSDILPNMSLYFLWDGKSKYNYANQNFMKKKARRAMNDKTWSLIESFYLENSAQEIEIRTEKKLDVQAFFEEFTFKDICQTPTITSLMIDDENRIYCACEDALVKLNNLEGVDTILLSKSVISQIRRVNSEELLLVNAGILGPHDLPKGSINLVNENTGKETSLVSQLYRPVYIAEIGDQYYISEYGHTKGRLSTFQKASNRKETVIELPGAYKILEMDADLDGVSEIIVQFSQDVEGIYRLGRHDDETNYERILSFPPEYGLSDIEAADMNGDGYPDLIMTNGDNADISYMNKAYHGVRIFLNDKAGNFSEDFFYPFYGASQLKVLDVDGDGELDMIVSSFFPHDIDQSIILLHKTSPFLTFDDYSFKSGNKGRWMVMEKGDIDQDGDIDIVLGSFLKGPTNLNSSTVKNWIQESVDLLVLKNRQSMNQPTLVE